MNNFRKHNFLVAAVVFFFSFSKGTAQIIYKDTVPDINVFSDINLDLDNNGIQDFSFGAFVFNNPPSANAYTEISILSNDTNGVASTSQNPLSLYLGEIIDSSRFFKTRLNCGNCALSNSSWNLSSNYYSGWSIGDNGYLGIRFLINNQIHYGWIRLHLTDRSITIYDWAYNSIPDSAITAGEIWTGINSSIISNLFASVITVGHSILVNLDENSKATISIYDCLGQLITQKENASGETKLEMENIYPGVYFVEIVEGEKFYSKKVYLQ